MLLNPDQRVSLVRQACESARMAIAESYSVTALRAMEATKHWCDGTASMEELTGHLTDLLLCLSEEVGKTQQLLPPKNRLALRSLRAAANAVKAAVYADLAYDHMLRRVVQDPL